MATPSFADRLRAARELRGLTQGQAAATLGVHRVTWAKWESGEHAPQGLAVRVVEEWIAKSRRKGGRRGS